MEWGTILALVIGIPVVLFPVAFIWFVNVGGMMATIKSWGTVRQPEKTPSNMTCSIDTDCPPGYICRNGICVPEAG